MRAGQLSRLPPGVAEPPRMQEFRPCNNRRVNKAHAAAPYVPPSHTGPPCPRFLSAEGNCRPNPGIASHKTADQVPNAGKGGDRSERFRQLHGNRKREDVNQPAELPRVETSRSLRSHRGEYGQALRWWERRKA